MALITRRRALAAGAAGIIGTPPLARARLLPSANNHLLRPGTNTKLRCAVLYGSQWPQIAYSWTQWDWQGFWKKAIDAAKSIGATAVKFNCGGVSPDGSFSYPSDAILRAELNQVCAYAGSIGMAVYLQLGYQPVQQFLPDGSGVAAGIAAAAKIAGWASTIPNIVAIDCLNEWDINQCSTWGGNDTRALADLTTMMSAVRAVCSKPLTISSSNFSKQYVITGLIDFLDVHYYYLNQASGPLQYTFQAASLLAYIRSIPGYPGHFILGETGMTDSLGAPNQANWMSGVPAFTSALDCYGGCCWTLADTYGQGLVSGNWGMFTQNFATQRPALCGPFGTWPGRN